MREESAKGHFDASKLADTKIASVGLDPNTLLKVQYPDYSDWRKRYLTDVTSPQLRDITENLPHERIAVFAYGSKIDELGGTCLVFVGLESKTVLALYRGR